MFILFSVSHLQNRCHPLKHTGYSLIHPSFVPPPPTPPPSPPFSHFSSILPDLLILHLLLQRLFPRLRFNSLLNKKPRGRALSGLLTGWIKHFLILCLCVGGRQGRASDMYTALDKGSFPCLARPLWSLYIPYTSL
jgi:hypothetical protein